jgi:MSHA pilin protein MshD
MMDEITAKKWDEKSPVGGGPICTGESPNQATRPALIDACVTQATLVASLGLDGTETRVNFNDVDDYDGLSEPLGGFFYDQDGQQLPGNLTGFTRSVEVDYVASNAAPIENSTPVSANATDTKRIMVTVVSPLGETFILVAVSCNF